MPGLSDEVLRLVREIGVDEVGGLQVLGALEATGLTLCSVTALDEVEALRAQMADLPRLRAIERASDQAFDVWNVWRGAVWGSGLDEPMRVLGELLRPDVQPTAGPGIAEVARFNAQAARWNEQCEALGPEVNTDA